MEPNEIDTERIRKVIDDPNSLDKPTYDWFVRNVKQFVKWSLHNRRLDLLEQATGVVDGVFLDAMEHFRRRPLNGRSHFRATMFTIAKQAVSNLYQSENALKRGGEIEHVSFDEARDSVDRNANTEWFEVFVTIEWISKKHELRPEEIDLLIDRVILSMSLEECAADHDLSVSTVQRTIRNVLAALRADVALEKYAK